MIGIRGLGRIAIMLLALTVPGRAVHAGGDLYRGPVTVIDGNTLAFGARRVRLFGSDAPELGQRCWYHKRRFDCGNVARTALMDLLAAQRVVCRAVGAKTRGGRDKSGRLRVRCLAGGYDVAENMVHTGWAVAARGAAGPLVARYAVTEQKARKGRRGLWRGRFIRPQAWRTATARGALCLRGRLSAEGVECQAMRTPDGRLYTLTGKRPADRTPGRPVCVCGAVARVSFCQQGTTIAVDQLLGADACP